MAEAGPVIYRLPQFGNELNLLMCCGGPRIQASRGERLGEISRDPLDWGLALRLAAWHGMLPLLYWNLNQLEVRGIPSGVPLEVMRTLKHLYLENVGRSLSLTGELLGILEKLEREGVVGVPYKGPVLSSRLYGNLSLRHSTDLDVIVSRRDIPVARQVLIDDGYVPSVMLHDANQDFQVESRYSERFDRPGSVVELHWAFTNKDVAFPWTLDDLAPRLFEHTISGRVIPVFSPEDTVLILCVHGAKHGWGRLEWICGIAEIISKGDELDWAEISSRATSTRSARRLLLGLCLAHDLYHVPLPDSVVGGIRSDRQISTLASNVTHSIYDGSRDTEGTLAFGTIDHDLFHFRLSDHLRDSLRYMFYRFTTPSRPERWSTVSIGGRSLTLHSFTRPFGIVAKLVPAVWRRLALNRPLKRGNIR